MHLPQQRRIMVLKNDGSIYVMIGNKNGNFEMNYVYNALNGLEDPKRVLGVYCSGSIKHITLYSIVESRGKIYIINESGIYQSYGADKKLRMYSCLRYD